MRLHLSILALCALCLSACAQVQMTGWIPLPPPQMPLSIGQYPWYGASASWDGQDSGGLPGSAQDTFGQYLYWPTWGFGSMYGTFGYSGALANTSLAWSQIQPNGSNTFEGASGADSQMVWGCKFNMQLGVVWVCSAYTNNPLADPAWATNLDTNHYAAALANFVEWFVARYSTGAYHTVTGNGVTNGLAWVVVRNEPFAATNQPVSVGPSAGTFSEAFQMQIYRACQGARTNGVQLAWGDFTGPATNQMTDLVALGILTNADCMNVHLYAPADLDPLVAMVDFCPTSCPSGWYPGNIYQYLNYVYTIIPSNMPVRIDEFGTSYANNTGVPPQRLAKEMIMARAGGATSFNFNPGGVPYLYTYTGSFSNEVFYPTTEQRAASYTAAWIGNKTASGVVTNGNVWAFSFGSGSNEITFACTKEGTTQQVALNSYTQATDIYSNVLGIGIVTVLTPNITVLMGGGYILF